MFKDVVAGRAGFRSKHLKPHSNAACDARPVKWSDDEAQTESTPTNNEMQTDTAVSGKAKASNNESAAAEKMRAFLNNVGPLMLREMATSAKQSVLFAGFEKYLEASSDTDTAKLHTLRFDYASYFKPQAPPAGQEKGKAGESKSKNAVDSDDDDDDGASNQNNLPLKLSCTGVTWNATGAVLAVAYGRFDHSGWCNYRSALCLWRVFQPDFNPNKPHTVLETSSGLMCVAFHPKNPSLVVAGSFSGEVMLWDLKSDDYRFYTSGISEYFHCEPVTKVSWVYDISETEYNVASVSGDGKVLYWRIKDKLAYPVEGYTLRITNNGGGVPPSASTTVSASNSTPLVAGGKAVAFSEMEKPSRAFVVGSEGGLIARCNGSSVVRPPDFKKWTPAAARLVSSLPLATQTAVRRQVDKYAAEKQVKGISLSTIYEAKVDPYALYPSACDFVFAPHEGPVYDLCFSPFRRGIFLSCASDGTVRLYNSRERYPILTIEVTPTSSYLYSVAWSKTRPMVFATAAEDGNVYIYDLKIDKSTAISVLTSDTAPTAGSTTSGRVSKSTSSSTSKSKSSTANAATTSSSSGSKPAMFSVDFNPRQRNFLAAGDAHGVAHIWKLSWQLANLQSGETSLLEALEEAS